MACSSCGSERKDEFTAEINIHLPKGLDQPAVWAFPKLEVCLGCGLTLFTIPQAELSVLHGLA